MGRLRSLAAVAALGALVATAGCIDDSDCGICDPDNLVLESITALNYANDQVHILSPECEGKDCPDRFTQGTYFIETIGPCEDTEEREASSRPDEYCKLAPVNTGFGFEFVFNNLLEATTIELVRKRPDNPNLFEVYDWKTQILEIQGPITRYNGDYISGGSDEPDTVTRLVNLACRDNLDALGLPFDNAIYEDPASNPCNTVGVVDSDFGSQPLKMAAEGTVTAPRGLWESRAVAAATGLSCDNPESGADSCCNQCDFLLSTKVAKYGLDTDPGGDLTELTWSDVSSLLATPEGTAITCDATAGDKFVECRDFVTWTDRIDETRRYTYDWCPPGSSQCEREHRRPYYDRLREAHPDERPARIERRNRACSSTAECNDDGTGRAPWDCVGVNAAGQACAPEAGDDSCGEGRCVAAWFVDCVPDADTTGTQGYCVDLRYSDTGAPACYRAPNGFDVVDPETGACLSASEGTKLAACDLNEDGRFDADECCRPELQGEPGSCKPSLETCEPSLQEDLVPVGIYERNQNLPTATRDCKCIRDDLNFEGDKVFSYGGDDQECAEPVFIGCVKNNGEYRDEREGDYAVKFIARRGGVIYDPAIKGFEWRPADFGGVPRAAIERCAEDRSLIPPRTIEDGWRANDTAEEQAESYEDFDRGMCSGQEYRVVFQGPPGPNDDAREYVIDKADNTLDGKLIYKFETPQFHVVPQSGFPTDNLRIGACDDFAIDLSNKYDMSPENLAKLQLYEVDDEGVFLPPSSGCSSGPVAGGPGCVQTKAELLDSDDACVRPCLTVDVSAQNFGTIQVSIDPSEFGRVLETGRRYSLDIPGLERIGDMNDPAAYTAAFWDVCGMPLVRGGFEGEEPDYLYEFLVDEPKCKEDQDRDLVQFSCDNAPDVFNPDQGDLDSDGTGDVIDLCPTIETPPTNSADSDTDNVGNECDSCRQTTTQYNRNAASLAIPAYLQVRNVPFQGDADNDGIGDVCDNCVVTANCEGFGPDNPHRVGDPIAFDDGAKCQRDDDADMIGDACQDLELESAGGPIGFGDFDDFDQDGIINVVDACPRQPLEAAVACADDEACGEGRVCERVSPDDAAGVCNHLDSDGDAVGDICDSCPFISNPLQIVEGSLQEDDEDGDFVGRECETNPSCEIRRDAKPKAFYEVSAGGLCCITRLEENEQGLFDSITGKQLLDPDGVPVTRGCIEDADGDGLSDGNCRLLPGQVEATPGIVDLPPGCDEALAEAGYSDSSQNPAITLQDVGGDLALVWDNLCFLPQFDQDYDGIGDPCDLCKYDFDPTNLQFIDDNGRLWPSDGKFCNGVYAVDVVGCGDDVDTGGSSGTGDESGSDSSSTSGDPTATGTN